MRHLALSLSLSLSLALAAPAAAQNCFDGDFGVRLGIDTVDTVYPMQSIGFPFPLGGTTYTNIHVNDHGFVELSNAGVPAPLTTGATALYTPTTANFVAGAPKICPLYCDMELTGGGECFLRSSPSECVVTWWNARSYGVTTAPRFSFQLILKPSGEVRFVFDANVTNNSTYTPPSDNGICGLTPGGGAAVPPASDLSAGGTTTVDTTYEVWTVAGTFDLANNTVMLVPTSPGFVIVPLGAPGNCAAASNYGSGCNGLALRSVGLPSLGNAAYQLRVDGVPAVSPIAFVGFGTAVVNPGLPLASLGMTGCSGYTNLDIGLFGTGPTTAGSASVVFGIPATPTLVGALLSTQGLALSAANPGGLVASNGTRLDVGFGL